MKNTSPKVSIIVPVYNAGERFVRCMDTLVDQTLREIEIILVLDCPTDGTDKIAKKYAENDERIVILENSENLHIGETRNRGLEIARGEYIGFSDHDDYRELTMYQAIYDVAEKEKCEILLGNMKLVGDKYRENSYPNLPENELKDTALINLLEGGDDKTFSPYAVNLQPNLYRRDFLEKHKIRFVDTIIITPEDLIFQVKCLFLAEKVSLYKPHLYYHTVHTNNEGDSAHYVNYLQTSKGKVEIYDFLVKQNGYEKYQKAFLKGVKKLFADTFLSEIIITKNFKKSIKAYRFLRSLPFTKAAFRKSRYSLERFRIFGKINRRIVFFLMQF